MIYTYIHIYIEREIYTYVSMYVSAYVRACTFLVPITFMVVNEGSRITSFN